VATRVPRGAHAAPEAAPAVAVVPAPPNGYHAPETYVVRPGEEPWTDEELREVHTGLTAEVSRLRDEIALTENEIADMLRDSGESAGDDQADAGTKNFEREHGMSLANHARGMLLQSERALRRLADGTYGVCESCGSPVGKARSQAFPRATLCVSCKQREERR
jgi:RNA polymerase-binding protein DksA